MRHLVLAAAFAGLLTGGVPAFAQNEDGWRHATSLNGEPKYPEGFEMFDFVNPDAPKGGTVRVPALGTFNTFNPVLPLGDTAAGLGLVYETLMTSTSDEISTMYGQIAEAMRYPDDYSSVTFRIDPDARWHDGEPVTPEDVVWSFETAIELSPDTAEYYAPVEGAEVSGEGEVTFSFSETGNRELPHIMGQLLVLPKHWWEGENAEGEARDIGSSTLEPPMGSGPYRLDDFEAGRTVTYQRVEDYWAQDKPAQIGMNNFDEYEIEYFRDTSVMFEAFKGDEFDWWDENVAARWATAYDFPAAQEGRVVRETFEEPYNRFGVMVAFIPNIRLEKFQDPRVREALNYAFDFEELNRIRFHGQYRRIDSYFFDTELKSDGLPEGLELEILEEVRDLVPESVFTEEYQNPVAGNPEALRENLREALRLFGEAGYTLDGNRLVDENGEQFGFEILLEGPTIEPIALSLAQNLNTIGANVTVNSIDQQQYTTRLDTRDFEVTYRSWSQSLSPGNEQRFFWGSSSADVNSSSNYVGISDPGIDALIEKIVRAPDREYLVAATRALDRVLLAHHFVVPSYAINYARTARWNRFSHPENMPDFGIGFPTVWWWDEEKAAETGGAGQ